MHLPICQDAHFFLSIIPKLILFVSAFVFPPS